MSDIDDFLTGDDDAHEEPQALPQSRRGVRQQAGTVADSTVIMALARPVSITFLMQVWGMDRKTIVKRLADLPPVGQHRGQQPLYDFRQAAQYLVVPRVNMAEYIKKVGIDALPAALQGDAWDAKLKSQKWKEKAGELWPTGSVLEVLGDTFQRIKTTTQLWIDQLSESHALPAPVRIELTGMVDALQTDMHRSLVEMPQEKATLSQLGEIEGTELDDD